MNPYDSLGLEGYLKEMPMKPTYLELLLRDMADPQNKIETDVYLDQAADDELQRQRTSNAAQSGTYSGTFIQDCIAEVDKAIEKPKG